MTFEIPVRTRSLTNLRWHWAKKASMAKEQRGATGIAFLGAYGYGKPGPRLPVIIEITRIAPCALDDDNLRPALKHVRDEIAARFGVDDRDPRISWRYWQVKGKPKTYSVRVTIVDADAIGDAPDATPEQIERWKGER